MKKYKAIFFDWDGTAVLSRTAPVDQVVVPMKKLLAEGVKLAVISGTTINNIGDGKLHTSPQKKEKTCSMAWGGELTTIILRMRGNRRFFTA